ncbi:hypothetical protein K2173_026354 [Erythroxylum novogranatense]|uniref:FAS1 domain-containing protein n=1 Tax=Erythroxylum novogranatense TaxID=1862640 RepID=A0AAV8SP00_9ROSI|nr:hypothetical protein K2173_026354 [Erythroxylum novogranatense]
MATYYTIILLLYVVILTSAVGSTSDTRNSLSQDLIVATEEMVKANYFTFVMLINMISPLDLRIQDNVTFLMPNDRMLSRIRLAQEAVSDFLLRHSIPSPLLFEYLEHIPSGSVVPSSEPDYMLSVYNMGRRHFTLNNVKIISPNICTAGSSIRCHGIDGILTEVKDKSPPLSCTNSSGSEFDASSPASSPSHRVPMAARPPGQNAPKKSGSSNRCCLSNLVLLQTLVTCVVLSIVDYFL